MTRFLGILGSVLLAFGIVGGLVISSFKNPIVLFHLAAGFGCIVIWFFSVGTDSLGSATQIVKGRSTRYGANAALYITVFAAILASVNWIVDRHNKRFDLTEQKVYSLSPQSASLIDSLKAPLKIVSFKFGQMIDVKIEDLLKLYKEQNPSNVTTEIIDPVARPQLVDKYGMKAGNVIYVAIGNGDNTAVSRINEPTEEALTNAILKLTRGAAKKIYFVQGHEERDIKSMEQDGFNQLVLAMKDEHLNVEPLLVGTVGSVPSDAAAVIVAAPKRDILPQEEKVLIEYAQNGGRLLLLHDPRTSSAVPEMAAAFGIKINDDVVLDQINRLFAGPAIGAEPIAKDYDPQSAITKSFDEQNITIYNMASSLSKMPEADKGASYASLVKSGESAWGETNLSALLDSENPTAKKEADDHAGPVVLAMSYEKKLSQPEKVSRVVVFGDTDWLVNANLRVYSNRDLFLNAVNWLAGEEGGLTIRAGTLRTSMDPISIASLRGLLLSSFLVPELVLLFGLFVWWRRRAVSSAV